MAGENLGDALKSVYFELRAIKQSGWIFKNGFSPNRSVKNLKSFKLSKANVRK